LNFKKIRSKSFWPLIVVLLFLSLIFILYPGLYLHFSSEIPGGKHGDVQNILSIINYSIHTPLSEIYHFPIFYPESYMLTRTHPLFGASIVFKAFHFLGLSLVQSYNLYIIFSLIMGAFGCFLLSGEFTKNKIFPLLFSALYISHQLNLLFFLWLNFLSLFYVPYVFYFFVRYFKTKKRVYIMGAALFAFLQMLASLYYGVQLWVFLIPSFLLFALILKIIAFKDLKHIIIYLFLAFVLIVFVFSPYLTVSQPQLTRSTNNELVRASDLFFYSQWISPFFGLALEDNLLYFFPGFIFLFFVLFFIVSFLKKKKLKKLLFIVLVVLAVTMGCFVYIDLVVLDVLFLIFLSLILFAVIKSWKNVDNWAKLIVLTLAFYLLVMFQFSHLPLLNSFSLFNIFSHWLPFEGFRAIKRVFLISLPFLIIIACIGGARFFKSFESYSKKKKVAVFTVILLLIVSENIRFDRAKNMMSKLKRPNPDIYKTIPFEKNKIILEIPFYFNSHNSTYSLNWEFHKNSIINGISSVDPMGYMPELLSIVGMHQNKFPSEEKLKKVISKYSVTHIIFRWNLIEIFQNQPKKKIWERVNGIHKYGKIIHEDERFTVLKTQEYIPIKKIIRTYAQYHLRKNQVQIKLEQKYSGRITVYLNNRLVRQEKIDSEILNIDLREWPLNVSGNRVEVLFQRPILLKSIELTDKHKENQRSQ